MKKINKKTINAIKGLFAIGIGTVAFSPALTSCEDFLTITPSNQIVEEDF